MVGVVFVILFHLEHKTIFMSLTQCFLQSLPIFPLRFRSARQDVFGITRSLQLIFSFCFVYIFQFSYRHYRSQKQREPQQLSLFVCSYCVVCVHLPAHNKTQNKTQHSTAEQKEVEACFVFDNVISFLLVVCKHFISLKSGIFSLVPQLPIAIYVNVLIVSNSICNTYTCVCFVFTFVLFFLHTCTRCTPTFDWSQLMPMQCHMYTEHNNHWYDIYVSTHRIPFFPFPMRSISKARSSQTRSTLNKNNRKWKLCIYVRIGWNLI